MRRLLAAGIAIGLSACGGGGSNDAGPLASDPQPAFACVQPFVTSLVAQAFSDGCESCDATHVQAVADGDSGSAAVLRYTIPMGESVAVRATADNGAVYAAGTQPGAMLNVPESNVGGAGLVRRFLRTYLNGVPQEESLPGGASLSGGGPRDEKLFIYLPTTQPYDALELVIQMEAGVATQVTQVFELCVEGPD